MVVALPGDGRSDECRGPLLLEIEGRLFQKIGIIGFRWFVTIFDGLDFEFKDCILHSTSTENYNVQGRFDSYSDHEGLDG